MRLPTQADCQSVIKSLPIVCLCGVVGILPDIDHVVAFFNGVPKGGDFRVWHPQIFIVVGIVMFVVCAFSSGLYIRSILRKKKDVHS